MADWSKVSTFALAFEKTATAVVLKRDSKAKQIKIFQKNLRKILLERKKVVPLQSFRPEKMAKAQKDEH